MAGCMLGTDDDDEVPWEKQAAHGSPGQHALADDESPRLNTASSSQRKEEVNTTYGDENRQDDDKQR